MITEIGAVKIRGGEVLGEFQTLVNPHQAIPPFIAVLTGITDSMVATAPPDRAGAAAVPRVRPGLRPGGAQCSVRRGLPPHFAEQQGRPWPTFEVLDTAKLARRVVTRDDAPNCKLSSLAALFDSATTPNHRALSDARATVDVLHGLMERLGSLGVHTLEELQTFSSRVTTAQRRKRHLAEQLPHAPGVYLFRDDSRPGALRRDVQGPPHPGAHLLHRLGDALPDGRDGRARRDGPGHRVRHGARGGGPRAPADRRAQAALQPAVPVPRAGALDQADRRAMAPAVAGAAGARRRRRLPRPVRLQDDPPSDAVAALHEAFPIRQCGGRMPRRPSLSACALAEMGRCLSPCDRQRRPPRPTPLLSTALRTALLGRPDAVVVVGCRRGWPRWRKRSASRTPARWRDRLAAFLRGAARTQRLQALTRCPEVVAARREDGRLVRARRPPRSTRGCRCHPSGCPCRPVGRATSAPRPRRCCPAPVRLRLQRQRRPRNYCAGSSPTVSGSSTSTVSGAALSGAPPSTSRVHDAANGSRDRLVPFEDRRGLRPRAPAGPLALRA